jgi:hypothetical protein
MKKQDDDKKDITMEEFLEKMSKAMNKETTDGRGDDEEEES